MLARNCEYNIVFVQFDRCGLDHENILVVLDKFKIRNIGLNFHMFSSTATGRISGDWHLSQNDRQKSINF